MKLRSSRIMVPALLIVAVIIVSLTTLLAYRTLNTLDYSQYWVDHTWEVINQVEHVMSSAKDAETGVRGYLITDDASYLAPYNRALVELPKSMQQFRSLTRDNPAQVERGAVFQATIDERLALLAETARLRETGETDSMHALVVSGTGKVQMDKMRSIADDAEAEERRLLRTRTATVRSNVTRTRIMLFFASGVDFLLILVMFRFFTRERRLREDMELTARSLAESRAEVVRNAEEIQALNVTLEERVRQRTAELENTNKELEAFSYSVSHDLRAPLRTIDGFSLALEEDYAEAVDATGRDYISRVRAGVQRMGMLIDALLQLSRVTRAEIAREEVDLTAMVEAVAANVKEENPGRTLEIAIDRGMAVNADPKLLRVAIENLLGNAAKFTGKVASPTIHFGWDAAQTAFFITDNGAGFDMHYADKLFGAFNRLHGDKDFKGSGIGLATVARVIARHHGRIWALGEADKGATFFFTVGAPHEA